MVWLEVSRSVRHEGGLDLSVRWTDKQATRLPEATWCSFDPVVAEPYLPPAARRAEQDEDGSHEHVREVAEAVSGWERVAIERGLPQAEIEIMGSAFRHDQSELAESLTRS